MAGDEELREVAREHPEAVERLADRVGGETAEWLRSYVDESADA